jgi:hypothetical protein
MTSLNSSHLRKTFILVVGLVLCLVSSAFAGGGNAYQLTVGKTLAGGGTGFTENAPAQAVAITPAFSLTSGGKGGAVATDPTGNIFVGNGNAVLEIDARMRLISTVAGPVSGGAATGYHDGVAGSALFSGITALATDAAGNIYIADGGNNAIRMLNVVSNTVCTIAATSVSAVGCGSNSAISGTPITLPAGVNTPLAIAVNAAGSLIYFADANSNIFTVSTSSAYKLAGNGPGYHGDGGTAGGTTQFKNPQGLTLDPAGNLYIADTGNCIIREINTSAMVSLIAGQAPVSGTPQCGNGDGALGTATLNNPTGIAYIANGPNDSPGLIITDTGTGNSVIRSSDFSGNLSTQVPSAVFPASASVYGIALASNGGYGVDVNNNVVVEMGQILVAGAVYMSAPLPAVNTSGQLVPPLNSSSFMAYLVFSQSTTISAITDPHIANLAGGPEFTVVGASTGQVGACQIDGVTVYQSGSLCSIQITFSPYRLGIRKAPLLITYTSLGSTQTDNYGIQYGFLARPAECGHEPVCQFPLGYEQYQQRVPDGRDLRQWEQFLCNHRRK